MPHSPQHIANRLAAVRAANARRVYVKTGPRPRSVIEKMQAGLAKWRADNPEAALALSKQNLPKDVAMEKNPNWRGGTTKESRDFHTRNSGAWKKWRTAVFDRDEHRCKDCGATERLECHHILPLAYSTAFAFHRANGVTLCRPCHEKTDSYASKGRPKNGKRGAGDGNITIKFIPQSWQDYDTCGNWLVGADGSIFVLVSLMGDERHQQLVGIHELTEALMCKVDGVTTEMVDAFDMGPGKDLDEPGNAPEAPYHKQHMAATAVEQLLADQMHVDWEEYDAAVGDHGVRE